MLNDGWRAPAFQRDGSDVKSNDFGDLGMALNDRPAEVMTGCSWPTAEVPRRPRRWLEL